MTTGSYVTISICIGFVLLLVIIGSDFRTNLLFLLCSGFMTFIFIYIYMSEKEIAIKKFIGSNNKLVSGL